MLSRMHAAGRGVFTLELAIYYTAPCTVAQQPALRRRAAWRGTRVTGSHATSVAAVRRY
jgi:hypothetical protein